MGAPRPTRWAAVPLTTAAMVLLTGCGTSSAGPVTVGSATPTLSQCVQRWNQAPLGNGRHSAVADGAFSPAALMFTTDGVCGLAFPPKAARATGEGGVFVNGLSGDYPLAQSPLQAYRAESPTQARLEARAGVRTNVHIALSTGKLTAERGATMPTVDVSLLGAATGCTTIAPPLHAVPYSVVKTTVSCPLVRTLI